MITDDLDRLVDFDQCVFGDEVLPRGRATSPVKQALHLARSRCAPQTARYAAQQEQMGCAGASEVLNLSSARRDRGAKPVPGGLAALSYL